jgi:hypothetical protein
MPQRRDLAFSVAKKRSLRSLIAACYDFYRDPVRDAR